MSVTNIPEETYQYPIPIVLCGKSPEIAKEAEKCFSPEIEVVYFLSSLESCKKLLPKILSGLPLSPSEIPNSDLGTHSTARIPDAIVLGRGYSVEHVIMLKNLCEAEGKAEPACWTHSHCEPPKPGEEPPPVVYAGSTTQDIKDALAKWAAGGRFKGGMVKY